MILYPVGYGTRLVDLDTLFKMSHVEKMHPEYARRLRAWIVSMNGHIGIGGSWRATGAQPDKPGFAPEGRSFHQFQMFKSGRVAFCAVDLVARNPGRVHRSPNWTEVPKKGSAEAKRWGLHCNISSEAWHMQPTEINGWNTWRLLGRREPAANYPLPETRRTLRKGDFGGDVTIVQAVFKEKAGQKIAVDGQFGPQTETAVVNVQRFFKLPVTKVVDPATWAVIDFLAALP
jgi:hypothetical protein